MAYPIVTNIVTDALGQPVKNAIVVIELMGAPSFASDAQAEVISSATVATDATGMWSGSFKPNSLYTVANTWYRISEPGAVWQVTIPNVAGPLRLQDLNPVSPSLGPVAPSAADQANASAVAAASSATQASGSAANAASSATSASASASAAAASATSLGTLVTTTTRTNLAPNPTGVNAGGWSTTTSLYSARGADTVNVRRTGSQSVKFVRTTTSPSTILDLSIYVGQINTNVNGAPPVIAGSPYAFSIWGMCSIAARMQIQVFFFESDGVTLISSSLGTLTTLASMAWGQSSLVVTAPPLAAYARISAEMITVSGNSSGGEITWWQDVLVEEGTIVGTYFDGGSGTSSGIVHAWTGTANASTSTETTVSLPTYERVVDAAATYVATKQAAVDYVRQSTPPVLATGGSPQNVWTVQWATGTGGAPPTGGTFTLTVTNASGSQTTSALAYNCAASDVQAALEALSNVGAGNAPTVLSGPEFITTFNAAVGIIQMIGNNSTTAAYPGSALLVAASAKFITPYTAAADTVLQSFQLTNTSTTLQVIVTLYYVLSGQTATLGLNDVVYHLVIQPGDTREFVADANGRYEMGGKVMAVGDKIQFTTNRGNIVNYTVSGVPAP